MMRILLTGLFTLISASACLHGGAASCSEEEKGEGRFLSNIRQLTLQGKSAGEGYFSPDGKWLIFQSEREPGNPFYQIYLMSLETGETHRVSPGAGKTTCSFIRPGTDEVLFASTQLDPDVQAKQAAEIEFRASGKKRRFTWDYDVNYDIFSCRRDGSGYKRLTDSHGYDAEGAYSPDGSLIVFCSLRNAYPAENLSAEDRKRLENNPSYFGEIYLMNADGSNQRRLTDWPGYDGGPFFSPDGQRIIWRHFTDNGMLADIHTMRLDGTDKQQLTDFGSMSWAPYYHPSNEYIIFHSNKHGFTNCELYLIDAQGKKEPVQVTLTDGFDGLPVFSPDGTRLTWTSGRTPERESQIFMAQWNHEAALKAIQSAGARSALQPGTFADPVLHLPKNPSEKPPIKESSAQKPGETFSPNITVEDLRSEVQLLASDEMDGRLAGTKGALMASDYLARYFNGIGLKPLGDAGSYLQEFSFVSGIKTVPHRNYLQIVRDGNTKDAVLFDTEKDFLPLSFTTNGEVEGQVVFAGYGLVVPGENGYDSYTGLDVKGKIVVAFHHVPEKIDEKRHNEFTRYTGLRYKAMQARERGAKAFLVMIGPKSNRAGELVPVVNDKASAASGIIAATISGKVAGAIFANSGKDIEAIQAGLDVEEDKIEKGFELPNVVVKVATGVEQVMENDRNVIGFVPAEKGAEGAEYIIVGAHYDHIGHGGADSLAHKGEEGQVHNGADDNASGVSLVLELAAAFAEEQRKSPSFFKRGIIFALWAGEELGCLGSSYFAEHPTVPLKNVVAYVNFDMVGRLRENNLVVEGVGSSNCWDRLLERYNIAAGFNLRRIKDPYLPTDVSSFYPKGIPVLHFFTGVHEDYNRPTDDPQTLNYDGIARIAGLSGNIIADLAKSPERPDYVKVSQPRGLSGGMVTRRTYWGTVPDFTSEVTDGVKISLVKPESPADKAGFKGGDVIVEIAGKKISNIYDYNFQMDAVGVDKPVAIVAIRDGQRVALSIVPVSKK
ncbi:MAG TPA: M28 family peptidase [Candidatus Brocadiaceae bacterium]|nr:M28 family peptidase [Candidatus Brocadiaceae bacterium]